MVNIKVAVRIRPFSKRELAQGDSVIVERENKSIVVTNPKIPERQEGDSRKKIRKFVVDFCYDPKDPETCSQDVVYREIGLEVLDSMLKGYNACVLAYGHSASGKTYTMMGIKDDPGLTPRICQGLFDRVSQKPRGSKTQYEIFISFLEIYNEKVRDLLADDEAVATTTNFSLRVREHPKLGPYVQDLSQHLVSDKAKLLELIAIGNKRRSTAATENNLYSSRSHTVFTILCRQTGDEIDKFSKVHLVDLAGSERANAVQSKTRLKEGANINKSLVTLGNVISALAESCENFFPNKEHSRTWQPFVPYRDSVLTWLLKDTLGGNSNTIMIATISPASSCLNETINTLRYAKKTKRIVNQPIINEDPKVKTIRELREEITRLKRTLKCFQLCQKQFGPGDDLSNFIKFMKSTKINSEWLDPGGSQVIVCESAHGVLSWLAIQTNNDLEEYFQQNNLKRLHRKKSEEENKIEKDEETEESLISNILVQTGTDSEEVHENKVVICRTASVENNACKINDEKESDVNEPVFDSLAPDIQFFSDSLENSSSLSLKTQSQSDAEKSEFEERDFVKYVNPRKKKKNFLSVLKTPSLKSQSKRESKLCSKRDYNSCEDLPKMLHRSRPDLIKSIFIHPKEEFPPSASQSCTDVSNFSLSTSENSLNSSGSVDMQPSENKLIRKGQACLLDKGAGRGQPPKRGKTKNNESFQTGSKKKNKRSEIVEAVTTRLYVSKRNPNNMNEGMRGSEKDECEDESELEELKLCKRARMKLFDLSRKLAMTRRLKKTMDNDTQTDFQSGTIRVKEKCVLTDQSGILKVESSGTNTSSDENLREKTEPPTIMNQVFIPRSSSLVVQCGNNVRVEIQGETNINKYDLATQTDFGERCCGNVGTSSCACIPQNTEWFSDDSLDLEEKTKVYGNKKSETKLSSQDNLTLSSRPQSLNVRSQESLANLENNNSWKSQELFTQKPHSYKENISNEHQHLNKESFKKIYKYKNPTDPLKKILASEVDHQVSSVFKRNSSKEETVGDVDFDGPKSTITFPLTPSKEIYSSENSFTSVESIDVSSSGETSSEDFVFYESSKEKESENRMKMVSDRELYTITENSEQSDPSDAFSPMQKQEGFARASQNIEFVSPLPKISPAKSIKGQDQWEEKRLENICENKMKTPSQLEESLEIKRPNKEITFCKNCQTLDFRMANHCWDDYQESISGLAEEEVETYPLKRFDSTQFHGSTQRLDSSEDPGKSTHQNLAVPNPGFIPAYERVSKNLDNKRNSFKTKGKSLFQKDEEPCRSDSEANCSGAKRVNRMDVQSNAREQFLKFDILNSSKNSSFTIDSPFLSGPSKKNQSTEALFPSDDSITFVFMGPAKPETSVLMEIVRRGLNKTNSSNENTNACRESKSCGVQCDSKLMRSVSVDTALFALSRIAKNQEPCVSIPRISSLNALVGNEIQTVINQRRLQDVRESSCQCDLDTECAPNVQMTNGSWECSGYSIATQKRRTEELCVKMKKPGDEDKAKKSVSWLRKPKCKDAEANTESFDISTTASSLGTSRFDLDQLHDLKIDESGRENRSILNCSTSKQSTDLDSGSQTRRVRFSKPESIADMCRMMDRTQEAIHSLEDVPTFINEITQVLKHLKCLSMSYEKSIEEVTKQTEDLTNSKNSDKNNEPKTSLKKNLKRYEVQKKTDQTQTALKKFKFPGISKESTIQEPCSLTWPRRRTTEKKPPTGNRYCPGTPKFSRSPLFSRCNDSSSNAFIDFTGHSSYLNRAESTISTLNTSSPSTTLNNSCGGESQSRPSSSRSIYSNGSRYPKDFSCSSVYSSMMISPRPSPPLLNFDWILDLEMDLKESCRRLEIATEEDRIRREISENKKTRFSYANRDSANSFRFDNDRKHKVEWKLSTRRQNGKCFGTCSCQRTPMNNCRCHLSNSYCSTFELDSFGPGSKHCHQLCMFCRKKDLEKYFSTPSLNTECNFDRCRLSCYGYCPCSSTRLRNVSSSPRAYMQNLLNLRRKIVKETKYTDTNYQGMKVTAVS